MLGVEQKKSRRTMLIQILSESLARRIGHSFNHRIQCFLGQANRPHTMVDTTGSRNETYSQNKHVYSEDIVSSSPKTALDNLEKRQRL